MKSFLLTFAALLAVSSGDPEDTINLTDIGPGWSYDAWNWLCQETAKGKSNQEIATFLSSELTIANFASARFSIYVGNAGVPVAFAVNESNLASGQIEVVNGTLCSKYMIAISLDSQGLVGSCNVDRPIDDASLDLYLENSLDTSDPEDPTSLVNAARAASFIGFNYVSIIASGNSSYGALAASTPSECDFKFDKDDWILGFFGFNETLTGFESLASKALIDEVAANPNVGNDQIASKVLQVLQQQPNNNNYWITNVNKFDSSTGPEDFQFVLNDEWNSTKLFSENIAGRNLFVTGLSGITEEYKRCSKPLDANIFGFIVQDAITNSKGNVTFVVDAVDNGDDLLGFDTKVIVVSHNQPDTTKHFVFTDCSFEFQNPEWKIFYYGLPREVAIANQP